MKLRTNQFCNITADVKYLFVFAYPDLSVVTCVDGSGNIEPRTSAKKTWLILALNEESPLFETKYDIRSIIKYSIEGAEYIQNL